MMLAQQSFATVLALCLLSSSVHASTVDAHTLGKYDYKRSFKKPYTLPTSDQKDQIPHFSVKGDVIMSKDYIRLVPGVRSQKGAVWSTIPTDYDYWSATFKFLISGRGRLGGDGFAFWYVKEPQQLGPVYGNMDKWDGLGLIFDTYDNDNLRNNPMVSAIINDGTKLYEHDADGEGQIAGSCVRHYRNPAIPTVIKVVYFENKLSVLIDTADSGKAFTQCFEIENLKLPRGYFFGVSAATGGLADDHDIFSFEVTRLYGSSERNAPKADTEKLSEDQQKKFDDVQTKVQGIRDKQEYTNENPDDNLGYSSDIEAVLSKLDTVVAMQMDVSSQVEALKRGGGVNVQAGSNTATGSNVMQINRIIDEQTRQSARMTEIESLLRKLSQDFSSYRSGVEGKTVTASSDSDPARVQAVDTRLAVIETNLAQQSRSVQQVLTDLRVLANLVQGGSNGKTFTNTQSNANEGLSTPLIVIIVIIVLLVALVAGYFIYQSSNKPAFKKFN